MKVRYASLSYKIHLITTVFCFETTKMLHSRSSKKSQKVHDWKLNTFLKRVDLFGAQIPGFNLKGETQVLTKTGGCLSVLLILIWGTYALLKFNEMVSKQNPFISETNEPNFYDYKT